MQKSKRVSPRWGGLWLRGLDEWLVIFQKVSGLALALYLIGHVLAVSAALGFGHNVTQQQWNAIIFGVLEKPPHIGPVSVGALLEYLVGVLLVIHGGANGFRLILMQWFGIGLPKPSRHTFPPRATPPSPPSAALRAYKYAVVIVTIVFIILATYDVFGALLGGW